MEVAEKSSERNELADTKFTKSRDEVDSFGKALSLRIQQQRRDQYNLQY